MRGAFQTKRMNHLVVLASSVAGIPANAGNQSLCLCIPPSAACLLVAEHLVVTPPEENITIIPKSTSDRAVGDGPVQRRCPSTVEDAARLSNRLPGEGR